MSISFILDTHALVHFKDDEKSSIVPLKGIDKMDSMCISDTCYVVWSDKKRYKGKLIFSGIVFRCICVITEIYASLKLHGLYLSFFKGALEDCAVEQEMFDGGEGSDSEVGEVIDELKKKQKRRKLVEENSGEKRRTKLKAKVCICGFGHLITISEVKETVLNRY